MAAPHVELRWGTMQLHLVHSLSCKKGELVLAIEPVDAKEALKMPGFMQALRCVSRSSASCILFSMNTAQGRKFNVQEACRNKDHLVARALDLTRQTPPLADGSLWHNTFVLDVSVRDRSPGSQHGRYEDADCLAAHVRDMKDAFKASPPGAPYGDSHRGRTLRLLREGAGVRYLIDEGLVKCHLLQLLPCDVRESLQTSTEGKQLLCQLGLLFINIMQLGYKLVHDGGAVMSPSAYFHSLESCEGDSAQVANEAFVEEQLAKVRSSAYQSVTIFPEQHYAAFYCPKSLYFQTLGETFDMTFVGLEHGEPVVRHLGSNKRYVLAGQPGAPFAVAALRPKAVFSAVGSRTDSDQEFDVQHGKAEDAALLLQATSRDCELSVAA